MAPVLLVVIQLKMAKVVMSKTKEGNSPLFYRGLTVCYKLIISIII